MVLEDCYEIIKRFWECVNKIDAAPKKCIFNSISKTYYRENYHSDILAYYLSYDLVKKKLIDWINRYFKENEKDIPIDFSSYEGGPDPKREEGRRDITIYSKDKKHAIIIENKSNGAEDQYLQIPRYYVALIAEGYTVDAIIYLNQRDLDSPDEIWTEENIFDLFNEFKSPIQKECSGYFLDDINQKLIIMTLNGDNGFTHNVIDKILLMGDEYIREKGLSYEIKALFENVVNGVYQLEITDIFKEGKDFGVFTEFIKELPATIAKHVSTILKKEITVKKKKEVVYKDFNVNGMTCYIDFDFCNVLENELIIRIANREVSSPDDNQKSEYLKNLNSILDVIKPEHRTLYKLNERDRLIYRVAHPKVMVDKDNTLIRDVIEVLEDLNIRET